MPHGLHDLSSLLQVTGLKQHHFADLIRIAQIIADPACGLSGRSVKVDWESFGITSAVYSDLLQLGERYLYASPNVSPVILWEQLTPISREWLIENKKMLAVLEEAFPARDED